ncbi:MULTISPECIES: GNAT family N-acetyltransferase [unclassified Microbacterium]|uniref:GNAT family N-acetyltransferase n=1 Tax=unclassified Microbacterium TaxID=2609290 RepID=UPI000EA8B4E6|nr:MULTISPECIES: GNAT family N-acetyltransferase [unclassified Microbacterium]MBT2485933.1 GNAT family N-acetyltransferase [Microbacterium sp. ISL-108]RKN68682.1 N-acetyltransferase [Microbacterium sp. CGR2]
MASGFTFSTDSERIDRARVHRWLSEQTYWAAGRPRELQDAAIDASRNYSVWNAGGDQVAYARVVTDGVTFAWLCDVFVDQSARGNGIGKMLVEGVIADLQPLTVTRILLATADAHGLYAQYGFAPAEDPNRYMIKHLVQM